MPFFLRKLITGNPYINEDVSGVFSYKWSDTVESGWEEAHLSGDTTTQQECEDRWGSIAVDDTLQGYKDAKNNAIDSKSGALILEGFTHQGLTFSMSLNAQANQLALDKDRGHPNITYPVKYANKDNTAFLTINNATEMNDMYWSAFNHKMGILTAGNTLKESVNAATDKAGVDAVVDNR